MSSQLRRFLLVALGTFLISVVSNFTSSTLLGVLSLFPAFILLIIIVLIGVVFDIIGVAATAATETPFHAMAVDRVLGARQAIWVVRNADSVATFANDMIGDIAGTLSGAVATSIVFSIARMHPSWNEALLGTGVVSAAAALTVGGKAFGKTVAIKQANAIIHMVGKLLYGWERLTGLRFTSKDSNRGRRRHRAHRLPKKKRQKSKRGE